jgi:hypothetical protein
MFFLIFSVFVMGCGGCGQEEIVPEQSGMNGRKLLFIGVDGLDPLLLRGVFRDDPGRLPNLKRIADEGFLVDLEVSSTPMLSPILWTSIASGYDQSQHRVQGWTTGINEPVSQEAVHTLRFWEAASQDGRKVLQIGSLLTSPVVALNGVNIGDALVRAQFKEGQEVKELEAHVYPASRADELALMIPDIEWLEEHPIVGYQLANTGGGVHPLATDEAHIRFFEKLWPELQPDIGVLYFKGVDRVGHLADPTSRTGSVTGGSVSSSGFIELGPTWIGDYYSYIDTVLGRLMSQIDPADTTVVLASDHGFEVLSEESEWPSRHRDPGVLMGWGQLVQPGVGYSTVNQFDLGVTLFALSGLAPGEDSHGRLLTELFALSDAPEPLGSWILSQPLSPVSGSEQSQSADAQVEELKALGYLDESGRETRDQQYR